VILICGIPTEPPVASVIARCNEIGAPFILFNQRDFDSIHLSWAVRGGRTDGQLTTAEICCDLNLLEGVYARLMDDRLLPELDAEPPDSGRRLRCRRLHDGLAGWIDLAPGRVVNRFRAMGSNASKPYQSMLIKRHNFRVPETLVTNNPDAARAFRAKHGRVIYKSISGLRSIVNEMGESDLVRLEDLRSCPVQVQAYVPGFDVRVHVVGDEVFATRIESPGTDYRYANHEETILEPFDLPGDLVDRCRSLSRGLGLALSGIDLRISPSSEVYCFEVNPSPAFSYYESHTGQPISLALAHFLHGTIHLA
jgi:RimK-like ATP-grasp domain